MKIVKSVLITLTLLIVLPIVVLIVYYQFDEKLDPKAAAWGEPRATTIPEAENGYYALIAMGAGDGADAPAYAREWIAEARAAAKENRPERRPKVQRAKRPDVCKPLQASCLNLVREKKVELTTALDAYTEDLARYRMLIDSKRFEEVLDYPVNIYSEIPSLRYLESARNAWLTQAALFAEAGNLEEAISAVERDVAYNRIMLVGARSWPIKNNSIAPYWTDLVFIADLLQQKATALEPFVPRLREMLKSIDPAALRRGDTLETYFGAIKPMLRNPREFRNVYMEEKDLPPAARMIAVVYRPNAAINYQYKQYSEMAAVFNQPPDRKSVV